MRIECCTRADYLAILVALGFARPGAADRGGVRYVPDYAGRHRDMVAMQKVL